MGRMALVTESVALTAARERDRGCYAFVPIERGGNMAKYLIKASYTIEGAKGLAEAGASNRLEVLKKTLASVGGSMECMYWAFGADDALLIVDLPDNVAAAALATAVGSSGAVKSYETVALLSAEEMDRAGKMTVDYRPPGR